MGLLFVPTVLFRKGEFFMGGEAPGAVDARGHADHGDGLGVGVVLGMLPFDAGKALEEGAV